MRIVASLLVVALLGMGVGFADAPKPFAAKGDSCVEPTDIMRRNHMDMLMHQRDDTMIRGVRTKKHSLTGCIDCHTASTESGEHIPINDEGQFCQACHSYTAVKIDCFQCHRSTPDVEVSANE